MEVVVMGMLRRLAVPQTVLAVCPLAVAAAQAGPPGPTYLAALQRAVAQAQERAVEGLDVFEDHSTWENAWDVRTEHFRIRTTRSYGDGMQLALGLERMLDHFREVLGTDFAPAEPFAVFLLPDRDAYNAFGEAHGAEHSSFYGSFHAEQHPERPVAAAWDHNPIWLRVQVTHSVVHQYLAAAWPGSHPVWVVEGLAAHFSIYWDYAWGLAELERLKTDGELVPLANLLRDPLPAWSQNAHARLTQLGMLFYWLLRYREDTRTTFPGEAVQRAPFRDYLQTVLAGRDPRGLPVHDLLQDPAALEKDFLAFEFPRQ